MATKTTRERLIEEVKRLMAAGGSYASTARSLGVNKGVVAGICRDYHIPSRNPPPRFARALRPQRARVSYQLAESEAHQCTHRSDGQRCAYRAVGESGRCPFHQK
jgi:hypothetical protein